MNPKTLIYAFPVDKNRDYEVEVHNSQALLDLLSWIYVVHMCYLMCNYLGGYHAGGCRR